MQVGANAFLVLLTSWRLNDAFGCKDVVSECRGDMPNNLLHQLRSAKSSKAEIEL